MSGVKNLDKYEYKVRSEEIVNLIEKEQYAEAVKIADTIDWRRVKSAQMLLRIAALYSISRRNEDSREMLLLAYERYPTNRSVVHSLCEVSIELDDVVAAIEYYKQFVKLAPKDNGVFTLRYRILEAQEASLEERIEILEELKKRDYQEEWAYELAYLYHRVGLSTKCVEECDDIILWFGDGPYVMKAMELKMLHVPLTDVQQAKYDAMLNHVGEDYSVDTYGQDGYSEEFYGEAGETPDSGDAGAYAEEESYYAEEVYAGQEGLEDAQSYGDAQYPQQDSYADGMYEADGYDDGSYMQDSYIDDGYGNLIYVGNSVQDGGRTGEFYVEQSYDENGSPISATEDTQSGAYGDDFYGADSYDAGDYYANEAPQPEEYPGVSASNAAAGDMSQYNTINLQKVVAEGMREVDGLFSDDAAYGEEACSEEQPAENVTSDTIIYSSSRDILNTKIENIINIQAVPGFREAAQDGGGDVEESSDDSQSIVYTGKVAQMVTGVSETAPEPDTGAIRKVLVPGEDARFIQADSDMDELRDITEKTVDEEHARMEDNDENVYHDQDIMYTEPSEEGSLKPITGQMRLEEVLEEWERKKLDNAKKHEEEIKQKVITQTGKIFANFDNSIKSGILGELEREETEAQNAEKRKPGSSFLEADVTDEMQQGQTDDAFDVEYITEEEKAQKIQAEQKAEYISKLGRVVAEELGNTTQDIPQQELAESLAQEPGDGEDASYDAEEYAQEPESDAEDAFYGEEEYAQPEDGEDASYDEEEYLPEPESDAEDVSYDADVYDEDGYDEEEAYDEESYSETTMQDADDREDEAEYAEDIFDDAQDSEEPFADQTDAQYDEEENELDPDDVESIAETAKEDALRTQEIKMNTAELSALSEKIVAATKKEATGAKREDVREFTVEEQTLFENFAVTKKIKKQIIYALDNMTLSAYTGNVIITGDAGIDTVRMAKNLLKKYQESDENFTGKAARITGEKINQRNLKEIFEKLNNGGIIIEKANGMSEEKLYEMTLLLNQENFSIVVILEDTKKEITRLLEKQAMVADYFNIRIDLIEMDNNALVAYAKNYALALEYSIDELGVLALYTRIANMQSGNHVVTKDEVRDIIDEAIFKSRKSKIKNFVDVLFARRYDDEDMIVLKERDFI